jgi:hypothetical protein
VVQVTRYKRTAGYLRLSRVADGGRLANHRGVAIKRLTPLQLTSNYPERSAPRDRSTDSTRSAASIGGSCSQIRTTDQPLAARCASVCLSRSILRRSFAAHQESFRLGQVPCSGHPCQKHPSTKTATFFAVNNRSARRLGSPGNGALTRYRNPRRCNKRRIASSASVSRVRWRDIRCEVAASVTGGPTVTISRLPLALATRAPYGDHIPCRRITLRFQEAQGRVNADSQPHDHSYLPCK